MIFWKSFCSEKNPSIWQADHSRLWDQRPWTTLVRMSLSWFLECIAVLMLQIVTVPPRQTFLNNNCSWKVAYKASDPFEMRHYQHQSNIFAAPTSSLKSLLISLPTGSTSWTWPAEKPMTSISRSVRAVDELKSWHVGDVPRYRRLSRGLVKSAAYNSS